MQVGFRLTYMDKYIDDLLTKEMVCDIALPRISTQAQLEDMKELDTREPLVSDEDDDSNNAGRDKDAGD